MRSPEYKGNWVYQYSTGAPLQRERVKDLMRAENAEGGQASDGLREGRSGKAAWVLWSALAILVGGGFLYVIARVFLG